MVFINIPYVPENERIDRDRFIKELTLIEISDEARSEAFDSVYNRLPRGVKFDPSEADQARLLLDVLTRMGIGYRMTTETEYPFDDGGAA